MAIRSITLRLGQDKDALAIALMSRDLIESGLGWSWTAKRVTRSLTHRDTSTVVACDQGRVVAFAIMYFGEKHAHLNLLAVRPPYQRLGLGRRLVRWMEESAQTAGIEAIYLEVRASNQRARRFYRGLGFQEMALLPNYYSGVEPAVWMAHDLHSRARKHTA